MANDVKIAWAGTPTDFSPITNLNSLADGNIWQSGEISDASPSNEILRISYELVAVTPAADDSLIFYLAQGDEASANEIWTGGIGTSESEISAAAAIAEVQAACPIMWEHAWQTSHGTIFKGHFDIWNFGPSWQLLIEANSVALAASTNRLRFRYGTTQIQ